jgi:ferredoxin, 2Fe-2S
MPKIIVTLRDGEQQSIPYTAGTNLMQAICEGGVGEMLALCGGLCSCATCHVHIDTAFYNRLGPVSEDEDALLSGSAHRGESSRLGCQVLMTEAFDGMKVTIAAED